MPQNTSRMNLELHASEPLYKQVEKRLLDCLARGEWKAGDRLPTEGQLADRFGVAVFTIRAGISELAAANILIRRPGKGTYVATHNRQRQRYQFTHIFSNEGVKILHERHLISFQRATPDAQVSQYLRLPAHSKSQVFYIESVLRFQNVTVATMNITVPATLFARLTARAIQTSEENLYAVYQAVCGVNVTRVAEEVHADNADSRSAKKLGIKTDDPVFRIDRIAYTYNDVPVEFRRRIHRAAGFHYRSSEGRI